MDEAMPDLGGFRLPNTGLMSQKTPCDEEKKREKVKKKVVSLTMTPVWSPAEERGAS